MERTERKKKNKQIHPSIAPLAFRLLRAHFTLKLTTGCLDLHSRRGDTSPPAVIVMVTYFHLVVAAEG